jgi:hypothetical protein
MFSFSSIFPIGTIHRAGGKCVPPRRHAVVADIVGYRNACAGSGWAGRAELDRLSRIGGGAASCGLQPTAFGQLVRDELLYA